MVKVRLSNHFVSDLVHFRAACAFCYYGLVLMTTELFETSAIACGEGGRPGQSLDTCAADCKQLQTTDYIDLLWTTLAEFPGCFFFFNHSVNVLLLFGLQESLLPFL